MTSELSKSIEPQKSRHRSPNYPGINLRTATEKITNWYKADGLVASPRDAALKHMGYEKVTSEAGRVLSALRSFGLIAESDGRIKLTARAVDIVARPSEDLKRQQAIQDAGLGPAIYRTLLKEYSLPLPSDTTIQSELIASKGFNPKSVKDFLKDFRVTLEFAGITASTTTSSDSADDSINEVPEIQVGDYVQWEINGTLQLPEPRRVRAIHEGGEWAFLDGSETGVPVGELTIVAEPNSTEKNVNALPFSPMNDVSAKTPPKRTLGAAPKLRSYSWALSGDFSAKLELVGEAQTEEDIDALEDYMAITVKALKRSLKAAKTQIDEVSK